MHKHNCVSIINLMSVLLASSNPLKSSQCFICENFWFCLGLEDRFYFTIATPATPFGTTKEIIYMFSYYSSEIFYGAMAQLQSL